MAVAGTSLRALARHRVAVVAAVVAVLAIATFQAAGAATGIGVVGGLQAVQEPGVGSLRGVAAFEAPDGLSYLVAVGREGIYTISMADPSGPVPTFTVEDIAASDVISVFESSGGRLHALLAGDGNLWAIDVNDPGWFSDWFLP